MIDREFQITSTPVIPGITFLEASAGTGKTYTYTKTIFELNKNKLRQNYTF